MIIKSKHKTITVKPITKPYPSTTSKRVLNTSRDGDSILPSAACSSAGQTFSLKKTFQAVIKRRLMKPVGAVNFSPLQRQVTMPYSWLRDTVTWISPSSSSYFWLWKSHRYFFWTPRGTQPVNKKPTRNGRNQFSHSSFTSALKTSLSILLIPGPWSFSPSDSDLVLCKPPCGQKTQNSTYGTNLLAMYRSV